MGYWIFSSSTVQNIEIAKERLLWGFWDREAGEKQRKNWRPFIRLYNRIKPFDAVFFQIAKTGEIHAVGIVKEVYYDDQTPIWPQEQNQVLFPWRVGFCNILFSNKPFISHFTNIANYIDGYGIGELSEHEFRRILTELQKKLNANYNLS
ncbi:MAG: EVE domain-containing protein [Candidatus Bathyarchaeota archaeon]|nr:EVE domain-containing protein [Candidatus Bathyarchaeota archaeon]